MNLYPIDGSPFQLSYHRSIREIEDRLGELRSDDLFHNAAIYRVLEEKPPSNTMFRYCFLLKENVLVGFYHFQVKRINLGESLDGAFPLSGVPWRTRSANYLRKKIASLISFYTLVSGNMVQTGNYGRYFLPEYRKDIGSNTCLKVCEMVAGFLEKENTRVAGILMKDFYEEERFPRESCQEYDYTEFSVQPNMILDIDPAWNTMEDYMSDLRSKYRVRTRRTWKKLNGIVKRDLSLEDLYKFRERMHEMYKNIALNASFNLFILDQSYFYTLKKNLKDKCKIIGYFLNDKMVGFFTILYNADVLDAHFLGYDPDVNKEMHLYHNMLYDLLEEGIQNKVDHLDFSRTAMAIKSSLGASPRQMYLYLKIRNKWLNPLKTKLLDFLTPEEKWQQRNPFKN